MGWGGHTEKEIYLFKKLHICFYTFKLQSPPFHAIHLLRCFFHCSEQFLNLSILMPFSASAGFCFTSSEMAKHFLLRTFFIRGNKKSLLEQDWVNREGGAWQSCRFGQKQLNAQRSVSRCTRKSPMMKWANVLSLQKKIHWSQMQPLTTMPPGSLTQMGS